MYFINGFHLMYFKYRFLARPWPIGHTTIKPSYMIINKLIVVFVLLPSLMSGQKNYPVLLDQYMQAQVAVQEFSGVVLVAQKDKVIYKKAFGLANREWNVPNTVQTKFRIGSITKQFTAAAILQLAEKGKLSLEDKLGKYFPDFPKGDSVTVHMLLNHTSGIKSYTGLPHFSTLFTLPYPKDSVVALFKNLPYDFSPGTKYSYNNSGYFLLGYIVEKVSGAPYHTYLQENVIGKAGLRNTALDQLDSVLTYRAMGYSKTPAGWKNAPYISMEFPYSAGALFSTVADLHQWNNALFGGKIVAPALFSKMTTPYLNSYGYGLEVDSLQNHKRVGHYGNIQGFASYSSYYPQDDVHVVILSNKEGWVQGIGQALAAFLFDIPVIAPYSVKAETINANIPSRYVGKYQNGGRVDTLLTKEGRLYIRPQGNGQELELKPESEALFFVANFPDVKFQFDVNKEGAVTKAYFIDGGVRTEIKKL